MGFETSSLIANLGTLNIIIAAGIVFLLVLMILVIITKCCMKLHDYLKRVLSQAFLNGIYAFWDGIYLTLSISTALNIRQYMDDKADLDSSMYASYVCAILVVFVHPSVILLICCKFKKLQNEKM